MRQRKQRLAPVYGAGIALFLACLASIRYDSRRLEPSFIHASVVALTEPVHHMMTDWGGTVRDVASSVADAQGIIKKNDTLSRRVSELETERAKLTNIKNENEQLRNLLGISEERKDLRLRMAKVARKSASSFSRVVGIELEASQGLEVGMSVIASGGLVGQIRAIVNEKPEVLLVTDARSAVDVVLEKSRTRGIAVGSGDQRTYRAELKYVDRAESAQDGERVLTTGDDGRFQAGLLLGTVRLDPRAPRRQISVIPAVHFEALDLVYVVLGETGLEPDGKRYKVKKK
ncbi:MAG: rod shape-determining protein MreC [Myxococcota bacterium]|nr:rod shape-determining protein MreC [Myxococcota bacterium]